MKNNYTFLLLLSFLFIPFILSAQNGVCSEIEPLCLTNDTVIFPNCFNGDDNCIPSAEAGPNYACLNSQPFPTWQYLDINQSGNLEFLIQQNTSFGNDGTPIGNLLDVDFIVWGPFGINDDICDFDNLSEANVIDCSFSVAAEEVATISNAVVGERYVLLITNFTQQEGFIKIEQFGGDGTTVCTMDMNTTVEACEGDTITLQASMTDGENYQWLSLDGGIFVPIPGETTAFLNVTQEGEYRVTYTLADNSMVDEDLTAIFNPVPAIVTPSDYLICDDDGDGFSTFMLSVKDAEIAGGNPDTVINYYITETDALIDVNPLPDLFINTTPSIQTIYARGESLVTGCFDIVPLNLVILDSPTTFDEVFDLLLEDTNNDGFEVFDLSINSAQILATQDSSLLLTLTYHMTQNDALDNTNPIIDVSSYTNVQNPQTIFVRLTESNGCFAIGDFLLILTTTFTDSDNDGIPDEDEDLNGNGDLDDDDTDDDDIPNYLDEDDDGDTVDTSIEIQGIGAGFAPQDFIDTDDDLVENYLDNDDDGDNILTINEDYNNNGSPLDDDLNNNGIPDFLDPDVALSVAEESLIDVEVYPNPTQDIVNMGSSSFTLKTKVVLYTIQGKRIGVYTPDTSGQEIRIDLSNVASGIYFAHIQSGNMQVIKQLIKK